MTWTPTTLVVLDGNGDKQNIVAYTDGTNFSFPHSLLDNTGAIISSATSALQTAGNASLATIATNSALLSTSALQTAGNNILSAIDTILSGTLAVGGTVAVSGSALPTGASTSALQTTGNTSLATIVTNTTSIATSANQATANTALTAIQTSTANIPAKGIANSAASTPVTIASDQAPVPTNATANTSGGATCYSAYGAPGNAALTNPAVQIKAGAGNIYGVDFANLGNADAYIFVYDSATIPNMTSAAPKKAFYVPAAGSWEEKFTGEAKISFTNGLWIGACTAANGTGTPSTGPIGNVLYK